MNYIETNKAAWEEAFDRRRPGWGDNNHELIKQRKLCFFNDDMKRELEAIDFKGKMVAQFCCNNGRELLSLMDFAPDAKGVGFDISVNILGQAKETADKAGILNCEFAECNILDIPDCYHDMFDVIFFTIGAITWFEDLNLLFAKTGRCLKSGGLLLINDKHPLMDMLPYPDEEEFNPNDLNRVTSSYFRKEPWSGNRMDYISHENTTKTFTDFSHTFSDIINGLSNGGMKTVKLNEFNYDIMGVDVYNNKNFPLSYILVASKE